ncbi:unnamed protein product [Gordionus sp. m RMFG-2023]|uniref:mucolipin-3-like n=1 Tax=Gordionus sp. m RMFG-2023 TaxID=3053472 RepID=UPI0030E0C24D
MVRIKRRSHNVSNQNNSAKTQGSHSDPKINFFNNPNTSNLYIDVNDENISPMKHIDANISPPPLSSKDTDKSSHDKNENAFRNIENQDGTNMFEEKNQQTKYLVHRRLKFFFMDPLQKWKIRKQFPWKLTLQLVKIVFVTFHIALFTTNRYKHVVYFEHTQISFKHLFLKDWESNREVISYPPSNGIFAIYGIDEFYGSLNYAIQKYFGLELIAIGSYDFPVNNKSEVYVELCEYYYLVGQIWAYNHSYIFDSQTNYNCTKFYTWNTTALSYNNFPFNFDSLIRVDLKLKLNTVHLKVLQPSISPDCYAFEVKISYDNSEHSGHLIISLDTQNIQHPCHGKIYYPEKHWLSKPQLIIMNLLILTICSVSLYLCVRALIRAHKLKEDCVKFFKVYYNTNLTKSDRLEFLNLWYVTILVNDILIILGTLLKLELERKLTSNQSILLYDTCGILLGCGCLLVWIGILRYLKFFAQYNVLLLTIKIALPNVIRYLVCAIFLYMGFLICGWVVFTPYHSKFRSISSSSECLFSLINGDDMFATFIITSTKSSLVWWFSRIYFYAFNTLFIYVVINLFISVILDTYESIKEYWDKGHLPHGFLTDFIAQHSDCNYFNNANDSLRNGYDPDDPMWKKCISCCFHKRFHTEDEAIKHILEDVET